ncbi:MAG: hypothetical protein ACXWR4_12585 [Bdellovibrionota bacterium]
MNQSRKIPFFLVALFAAAAPNAYPAATPAPKASDINCDNIRDQVLNNLIKLRTTPDEVAQKCNWNSTSKANNDEEESVGDKKMSGACQLTYGTINHYSNAAEKKLNEVCQIVEEAKAMACDGNGGQNACNRNLAAKDREAAKKLKELSAMLKKAQKTLATRQKSNLAVAEKYKKVFATIDIALAQTPKGTDLKSAMSTIKTDDIFGPKSPDAWTALSNNQLPPAAGFYQTYNQSFPTAFDEDGNTTPQAPQPAPGRALGTYTQELSDASGYAGRAIQYVNEVEPKVSSASQSLEQRASQVGGNGINLGSIDTGSAANAVSSLSGTTNAASKLASATGASRAIPLGSGLAGGGDSSSGGASSLPTGSGNANPIASTDLSVVPGAPNSANNPADTASGDVGAAESDSANKNPKAEGANNELLSAFAPIGVAAEGEDPELKAATKAGANAAAAGKAAGGSGAVAISSQRRLQLAGTYQSGSSAASAGNGDAAAPVAGGLRPSAAGRAPASISEDPAANGASDDKSSRLREMLRRRLAERESSGGDADASSAVDDLLYANPERAIGEKNAAERTDARNEQAGPQGMESEPLFQRVHHAHRRFLQRSFPRQAGI